MGAEAALVATLASSAGSAIGSIQEGMQAKKWGKYQAKQAKADGRAALGAARLEAKKIREAASEQQGQAVAAIANSNVVVGEGSAGLIEKQIRQRAEEDAVMAIFDGEDTYKRQAAQAKAYRIQGDAAFKKSLWGAAGSAVQAVSGIAGYLGAENAKNTALRADIKQSWVSSGTPSWLTSSIFKGGK